MAGWAAGWVSRQAAPGLPAAKGFRRQDNFLSHILSFGLCLCGRRSEKGRVGKSFQRRLSREKDVHQVLGSQIASPEVSHHTLLEFREKRQGKEAGLEPGEGGGRGPGGPGATNLGRKQNTDVRWQRCGLQIKHLSDLSSMGRMYPLLLGWPGGSTEPL